MTKTLPRTTMTLTTARTTSVPTIPAPAHSTPSCSAAHADSLSSRILASLPVPHFFWSFSFSPRLDKRKRNATNHHYCFVEVVIRGQRANLRFHSPLTSRWFLSLIYSTNSICFQPSKESFDFSSLIISTHHIVIRLVFGWCFFFVFLVVCELNLI